MPVLIILLFYINDLVKIKRMLSQTEFVAQQMANMIQNISQKRADKKITKQDIANIHSLAWKTVYPGVSMYKNNSVFPMGHKPVTEMYYVEGLSNGNASCKWRIRLTSYENPSNISYDSGKNNKTGSVVKFLTDTSPANIYPTLKINPGERKIIINALLERKNGSSEYGETSDRVALGLRFVDPPMRKNGVWSYMFQSVVIFLPKQKQNLFDPDNSPS